MENENLENVWIIAYESLAEYFFENMGYSKKKVIKDFRKELPKDYELVFEKKGYQCIKIIDAKYLNISMTINNIL